MITRRHLLLAIAATCFVTMFLISTVPIFSQPVYNPLYDVNGDGKIDMKDIALVAKAYGTTGTPINITAMLLNLQSEVDSLNSSLLTLENTVAAQQITINNQQSAINNLGAELATKMGQPDYDSGWFTINQGQSITLTDNLSTTNVLVYMFSSVGQVEYGGDQNGNSGFGAYWSFANIDAINVYRMPNDLYWTFTRVYMWKLP
jgi:hypothetical protein